MIYYKTALILKYTGLDLKYQLKAIYYIIYLYIYSLYLKIKKTLFKAEYNYYLYISYICIFSSIIYYNNLRKLKKFVYNEINKDILIKYKGNILYYILKLNK